MSVVAAATNAVSPTLDNATDSATALTTPKEVKEITEATANDLVVDSAAKPAPMPVEEGAAVEAGEVNDAKEKATAETPAGAEKEKGDGLGKEEEEPKASSPGQKRDLEPAATDDPAASSAEGSPPKKNKTDDEAEADGADKTTAMNVDEAEKEKAPEAAAAEGADAAKEGEAVKEGEAEAATTVPAE